MPGAYWRTCSQGFDYDSYLAFWDLARELKGQWKSMLMVSHLVHERSWLDRSLWAVWLALVLPVELIGVRIVYYGPVAIPPRKSGLVDHFEHRVYNGLLFVAALLVYHRTPGCYSLIRSTLVYNSKTSYGGAPMPPIHQSRRGYALAMDLPPGCSGSRLDGEGR